MRGGGEIFRFLGWEVRCQENINDIFGEKVRKNEKPGPSVKLLLFSDVLGYTVK